jgi:hypothetical protein
MSAGQLAQELDRHARTTFDGGSHRPAGYQRSSFEDAHRLAEGEDGHVPEAPQRLAGTRGEPDLGHVLDH